MQEIGITYIYRGYITNSIEYILNGEAVDMLYFNTKRTRISDSAQRNNEVEAVTIPTAQAMLFSMRVVDDGSEAVNALYDSITKPGHGLNDVFTLVKRQRGRPDIAYNLTLVDGDVIETAGTYTVIEATLAITEV